MSKFPLAAVATVLLLWVWGIAVPKAAAQEGDTVEETEMPEGVMSSSTDAIGLLDIGYIFKGYPRFLDSVAELKLVVEKAEEEVKQKKSEVANLAEQMKIHPLGTDEYTILEDRVTALQAELTAGVARQKRDFVRREARIYHKAYQEVVRQSEQYARQNGIVMVLRVNRDEVNLNDPKSVLTHINKPIVWYDKDRDITEAVLQRLIEQAKEEEAKPEAEEEAPEDGAESGSEAAPAAGKVPAKSVARGD